MRPTITEIFSKVIDPRVTGRCLHRLEDILFIAFCTLLSNGEDYEDMVEFACQRQDWLEKILELPNGIPSHDTFNRVLQLVDPEGLHACLAIDGSALVEHIEGKLVSFDGKKMRGVSPKSRGNKGLYILSAWVNEQRVCIGQEKVGDKSNEITAIPRLIERLNLAGSTISIDAMGCQTEIAAKILDAHADYLLAVKKNQGRLWEEVSDWLPWAQHPIYEQTWEYDHGRYEERTCQMLPATTLLSDKVYQKWKGIQTIVRIEAKRTENGVTSTETRYYISSQTQSEAYYNEAVRGHWGIENHLHWHLDVTFNEDANRSRTGNAPQNLNILRKIALQRIASMDDKLSLKKRRFRASMNPQYLQDVLGF